MVGEWTGVVVKRELKMSCKGVLAEAGITKFGKGGGGNAVAHWASKRCCRRHPGVKSTLVLSGQAPVVW